MIAEVRAFAAAGLKEWRLIRRYPLMLVGMLFWPLALPGVYVLQARGFSGGDPRALQSFAALSGTTRVAAFLFVGWSVYMWLSNVLWGPGTSLRQQQVQGQLEAVFLTPATRLAVLFGPVPASLGVAVWMFGVVGLGLRLGFGFTLGAGEALRCLLTVAVSIPAMYGLGALFSAAVLRFKEVNGLVQVVRGLCTVFCGMTYPLLILPQWARAVAYSLPPTYIISDFRGALLTGASTAELLPTFAILLGAGLLLCVLAALALRSTEDFARRGGSLVQY